MHNKSAMGKRSRILLLLIPLSLFGLPLQAHEVKGQSHSHAFEQTGYGKYRQGHSVSGKYGDIIIWSPRTYGSYMRGTEVEFARPEPYTGKSSSSRKANIRIGTSRQRELKRQSGYKR